MSTNIPITIIAALSLLLLLSSALYAEIEQTKSFAIQKISISQLIGSQCTTENNDLYTFTFSGGNFTQIAIPILLSSLYQPIPSVMFSTAPAATIAGSSKFIKILKYEFQDPTTVIDKGSVAKFIVLQFEPVMGTVTFDIKYSIIGFLASEGSDNVMRWATVWPIPVCRCASKNICNTFHHRFRNWQLCNDLHLRLVLTLNHLLRKLQESLLSQQNTILPIQCILPLLTSRTPSPTLQQVLR